MKEKYLVISNEGTIEEKALNLIGASDKRNDSSKIGYFGSGLKYALAYLLRNDYDIEIYSGKKEIKIDTIREKFREQWYDIIRINKTNTSFTTSMGPDWELWFAIREIYSNAIDEGGPAIKIADSYDPVNDRTLFVIKTRPEIHEFMRRFDAYFAFNRSAIETIQTGNYGGVKVYAPLDPESASIYRKGIRCYETRKRSCFDYDISNVEINESRVIKYSWRVTQMIKEVYVRSENTTIIRGLLEHINDNDYIEHGVTWGGIYHFTDTWLDAISGRVLIPNELSGWYAGEYDNPLLLPGGLVISLSSFFKDKVKTPLGLKMDESAMYREVNKLSDMHKHMWDSVLNFCSECGYKIPYDVRFVEFDNDDCMGSVRNKTVLIGLEAFRRGKFEVLSTLMEEVIHIESGKGDETREFQNAIIRHFINYMQNRNVILI